MTPRFFNKTPNRRRPARDLCGLVTACGPPSRPKRSLEKKIGVTYLRTRYWFSHGCDGFYLRALQKSHAVFVFQSHFSTPQTEPQKLHRGPRLPLVGPTTLVTAQQHQQWQQAYKLWRSIHKRCCFDCNSIWRLVIRNPLGQFWNIIKTSQQQVGDVTQLVYQTQRPVFL